MSGFDLTRFASKRSKRAKHIIKDGKRYLEREGRLIEVETITTEEAAAAEAKHRRSHIGCPLGYLEDVCRLTEGRATVVVAIYIYRRVTVCKRQTVTLPGAGLAALGIDRWRKYRALVQLARAGIIRIEKGAVGYANEVTLLWEG